MKSNLSLAEAIQQLHPKMTPVQEKTASPIDVPSLDRIGEIRQEIKKLKAEEEELAKFVKPQFEDGQVFETSNFRAELVVRNDRILDQESIRKRLGQKKYLELAKVGVTELKKVMGADDIDACTQSFKPVRVLDIDPIDKGGE